MEGWDTHYLGANMPDEHLVKFLIEDKPDILAISVTLPLHIDRAATLIKKVREDERAGKIKIMASAGSAKEAIEIANKLLLN